MSKILIDSEVLQAVMEALDFGAERLSMNYTDDYSELVYAKRHLESAIKNYDSKRFGVLEWHPMSEKPEKGKIILVRHRDKSVPFDVYKVGALILDGFDYQYANVKEWAYLPE